MIFASAVEIKKGAIGPSTFILIAVVLCLFSSAFVCTRNIPEKWKPGAFDIVHSHVLMHVLVYLEYYFEYLFIWHHMESRNTLVGH
jgi:hypothetical protein